MTLPPARAPSVQPPDRLLLCLHPDHHHEFYFPLRPDERLVCPYDRSHPVAVYQSPTIHQGEDDDA